MEQNLVKGLIDFIDDSPCSYFAVKNIKDELENKGFKKYDLSEKLDLSVGDKGYFVTNDSGIIAFNIFSNDVENKGFKIAGSHTDSPGFRIKSNPVMKNGNNVKLNTEVYGGPILSTWFDRVLSIAGRVALKSEDVFNPEIRLINVDRDLLLIPNLAIHMNREINKGFEYNAQKHTLPLISLDSTSEVDKELIEKLISEEFDISLDDILDYDLYLYDREKGKTFGLKDEFISVGRQDNLSMAYTSLRAFLDSKGQGINIFLCNDNEEVGSRTIQGADSSMLSDALERITLGLGKSREEFLRSLEKTFLISGDMAHAVHPNFEDAADPTNRPKLGGGPVIKYAANKSYTSDAYSASVFKNLCHEAGVEVQEFHNRSDKSGGSTIGPITSTHLQIRAVDIGGAMLGMHSIRELGAVSDVEDFYKVFSELYKG